MSIMLKEMPSIHLTMLLTGKKLNISKLQDNYLQVQTNHFTFDKVETYAVRMRMKKADGKAGVGLTEITILGSKVPSATSSEFLSK